MSISNSSLNYTDLNSVSQLKSGAKANSPENIRKVAEQFESLFVNMMVKSMRDANAVFAEGNPLNTPQTRHYQDMYDNQLSIHLAESKGLGMTDALMRQLSPQSSGAAQTSGSGKAQAVEGVDQSALLARRRLAISTNYSEWAQRHAQQSATGTPAATGSAVKDERSLADTWQPLRGLQASARSAASSASVQALSAETAGRTRFANADEFVETMLPMAEKAAARLGVDPHYLVAQAALETGWGKSIIKGSDGASSYNLFGIKSHGGWQGESASVMTTEFRNGVAGKERAAFRSYDSWEQSFEDYVNFLETNGRYQQALSSTANPDSFFRELQQAGYATDPQYASKVSQIARKLISESGTQLANNSATADSTGRA
ncbi:MAG: flagellar assembly peptidoglycan hydrolase FlgJ [Halopseudomonas sp.]|uniref:flagellar assembly peptidoglycan hydrolase FlgJ n=1 Tax=Halopseudomonas sp. TaxID=2901191 RepID=UPI0030020FE2